MLDADSVDLFVKSEMARLLRFATHHVVKACQAFNANPERRLSSIILVFTGRDPAGANIYHELAIRSGLPDNLAEDEVRVIGTQYAPFLNLLADLGCIIAEDPVAPIEGTDAARIALFTADHIHFNRVDVHSYKIHPAPVVFRARGGNA